MSTCENNVDVWRRQEAFPSVSGCAESFVDDAIGELEKRDWPSSELFGVRLAFEEALANAIEHGNKRNQSKSVLVTVEIFEKRLLITIRDEGQGFPFDKTPNPSLEENLEKPTGRGLFLIKNFMTRVWHNDSGNCIYMEKSLPEN